jgi:hypothetical protein
MGAVAAARPHRPAAIVVVASIAVVVAAIVVAADMAAVVAAIVAVAGGEARRQVPGFRRLTLLPEGEDLE